MGCDDFFLCEENSTYPLPWRERFCPVVSEHIKPYFIRFLKGPAFCLEVSKIVIFCGNGVVKGR